MRFVLVHHDSYVSLISRRHGLSVTRIRVALKRYTGYLLHIILEVECNYVYVSKISCFDDTQHIIHYMNIDTRDINHA